MRHEESAYYHEAVDVMFTLSSMARDTGGISNLHCREDDYLGSPISNPSYCVLRQGLSIRGNNDETDSKCLQY